MPPSPICEVQDGSGAFVGTTDGVDVTSSNTITIRLADSAAADPWTIRLIGTDELLIGSEPALTVNHLTHSATFTAPAQGSAMIFESIVANGVDANNRPVPSYRTTFGIYVPESGFRVGAFNEEFEGNATVGWVATVNAGIRHSISGGASGPAGGALDGTYPDPSIKVIDGDVSTHVVTITAARTEWTSTNGNVLGINVETHFSSSGSPHVILAWTPPDPGVDAWDFTVVAIEDSTHECAKWAGQMLVQNVGGTIAVIGSSIATALASSGASGWSVTVDDSSGTVGRLLITAPSSDLRVHASIQITSETGA